MALARRTAPTRATAPALLVLSTFALLALTGAALLAWVIKRRGLALALGPREPRVPPVGYLAMSHIELGLDTFGDVTVRLAQEFGFCYGVDRAVDYAYETAHKFPDKRIYLIGEIIHNPHVNNRLADQGVHFLYPTAGEFDFSEYDRQFASGERKAITPEEMLKAANRLVMPCRWSSWVRRSGMPGIIGSTGWERSSAWIWDFSSTHSTKARSGGLKYNPTMSRTLSMNSGSVESLKVSARWGCRPKARQMRTTAVCDRPLALAIVRLLQCVAS